MTNYKVEAHLLITSTTLPNDFTEQLKEDKGCVNGYKLRGDKWKAYTDNQKAQLTDAKNDFFIFTVARIKTSMQ